VSTCIVNIQIIFITIRMSFRYTSCAMTECLGYDGEARKEANLRFIKAEEFFLQHEPKLQQIEEISYHPEDQILQCGSPHPLSKTGRLFRLSSKGPLLLLLFCRPRMWNMRLDNNIRDASDVKDINSYVGPPTSPSEGFEDQPAK
jgi:hypothetical protein